MVFVFMGLSFRILDGVHEPILAITALTIIIYDMYENMERCFGVRCGEIRAFHPPRAGADAIGLCRADYARNPLV